MRNVLWFAMMITLCKVGRSLNWDRATVDPEVRFAGRALMEHINAERAARCRPMLSSKFRINHARFSGVRESNTMILMEVGIDSAVFQAVMQGDRHTWNVVGNVVPDVCDESSPPMLTYELVDRINSANLTWKATMYPRMEKHIITLPKQRRQLPNPTTTARATTRTTTRATTTARPATTPAPSFQFPSNYDSRDVLEGQPGCVAFDPRDQNPCGWCVPFAAASSFGARMCLKYGRNTSRTNTVFSPQQIGDCVNGGCSNGVSSMAPADYYASSVPITEEWCNPFTGATGTCGSVCAQGNAYAAVAGSASRIGQGGYEAEIMLNGPGVVYFDVYNDFFGYKTGIYNVSSGATYAGAHALSLVGWGVDNGVPYWLCQNSFGSDWGENGFVRILRGKDIGQMESQGMVVITPAEPTFCPESRCTSNSRTLSDCSCACQNQWTGPRCDVCQATCFNGGYVTSDCTCRCPLGTSGLQCERGITFSKDAACGAGVVSVAFNFADAPNPGSKVYMCDMLTKPCSNPYQGPATEVQVCTSAPCPLTGIVDLPIPTTPGQYTLVYAGMAYLDGYGFYFPPASAFFGVFNALPAGCSADQLASAAAAAQATRIILPSVSPANYTLMAQRLADSSQAVAQLQALGLPAVTSFTGSSGMVVQNSQGNQLCYNLPQYLNTPQKTFWMTIGNVDGSPYTTGFFTAPPASAGPACVNLTFSGFALDTPLSIRMVNGSAGSGVFFSSSMFVIRGLDFGYKSYSIVSPSVRLTYSWKWATAGQSVYDIVRVFRASTNAVYAWFYTYCNCQTPPGPGAVPAGNGTSTVLIPMKTGAYPIYFYPGGGNAVRVPSFWNPNWNGAAFK